MKRFRWAAIVMLALAVPLFAENKAPVRLFLEANGSPGQAHALTLPDMLLHPLDGFFYNESYFLIAITNEGYYGYVQFLVSNSGVRANTPAISFTIVTPDRKRLVRDVDFAPGDLVMARDHFELKLKTNFLKAAANGYDLKVSDANLGIELHYQNQVPGFRLGNGRAVFGTAGDFLAINYPAPRPIVTGRFQIEGKTVPISGWGYMDHSYFNTNPSNFERVWHNFKFHSDTHTVLISSFTVPPNFARNFGHAVVTDNQKILCTATDVRVTEEGVATDAQSGKPYPKRVRYEFVGDRCTVRATMDSSKITEKFDVLAKLDEKIWGRAAKIAINALIAEPWYFRSVAPVDVELVIGGAKTVTRGLAFNEIIFTQ